MLGKGTIVGRNTYNWSDPQHVTVMPDGCSSLKSAWVAWPISLVKRAYVPLKDETAKHIFDEA
jgi:hypothetical protein